MTLSLKPQQLRPEHRRVPDAWYYEENSGLVVVVEVDTTAVECNPMAVTITLPWRKLRASLRRKDAVSKKNGKTT